MLGTVLSSLHTFFYDIFTATVCFIISLFYDEKFRLSEIEQVALVVELVGSGVGI